jgi:hypothetical protein
MASYYYDHLEEEQDELLAHPPPSARTAFVHESPLFSHQYHREALISSMYLGGAGAFLSLPALCFWDFSVSASFLLSLTLVALLNDHTKHAEFRANQDKQRVLAVIRRFRWLLYAAVVALVLGVLVQDAALQSGLQAGPQPGLQSGTQSGPQPGLKSGPQSGPQPGPQTGPQSWPMMLLSFSSPLLMRAGPAARKLSMSPSQTLEVGLPVSNLLAILVLCWYSPLDNLFAQSSISMPKFVPMLVLCPSCLAAVLAFILRGFRHQQTLGVVVPLVTTCIVVQQIMDRKMRSAGDWALVGGAAGVLALSLLFVLYRQKVLAPARKDEEAPPPEPAVQEIALETLT